MQAAAISGGVVVRRSARDDEIRDFVGPFTRVVNLRGRLAIPAFGDAHVHPVQGGLESLRCNLAGLRGRQEYLATIAAYCATLPRGAWVLGGGWSMPAFPGGTPNAADLDAVTGGRPAFLPNRDHHSAWVNTAALDAAGVTGAPPTRPTAGSSATTRANPTGALHDGAMRLVADYVPPPEPGRADRRAARRPAAPALARHHHHPGRLRRRRGRDRHARHVRHLPAGRRGPAADLPGDRGAVVGPVPRPAPARHPAGAPGGGRRRRLLPRHLGQADARRRLRDLHRRDGRAVPGRPRARHGPLRVRCSSSRTS